MTRRAMLSSMRSPCQLVRYLLIMNDFTNRYRQDSGNRNKSDHLGEGGGDRSDAKAGSGQAAFRLHRAGGAPGGQESKSLDKACQAAPEATTPPTSLEATVDLAY